MQAAACGLQLPVPGPLLVFYQPPIFKLETEWGWARLRPLFEMAKGPLNISQSRVGFRAEQHLGGVVS